MRPGVLTDDPAVFLKHYGPYKDIEDVRARIQKHVEYKTCRIIHDADDHICAVCLWNIVDHGKAAHVVDLAIREDRRRTDMMRKILRNGMSVWPVEFLIYDRNYDETNKRGRKVWSVERFLRRKG